MTLPMIVGARGASNRLNSILLGDDGQGHAEQSADGAYDQLTACLGGACYDVYLNDVADWRCVPARVCSAAVATSVLPG